MDIEITYPPKTAGVQVPYHFLAIGKKVDGVQPMGVMLSVNDKNQPDGKYRIGGETRTLDPKMCTILFRIPSDVLPDQKFTLVVFDTAKLPSEIASQKPLAIRENLYVRRESNPESNLQLINVITSADESSTQANRANNRTLLGIEVAEPQSGGTAYAAWFLAQGQLPQECEGVDDSATRVVNADNSTQFFSPLWIIPPDETGYWYALFPDLTGWLRVNLRVVYTPNGSAEEVVNVTLV